MSQIKYFIQFILIIFIFLIFKILGVRISSFVGGKLIELIGPMFRSKAIIQKNIKNVFPEINTQQLNKIKSSMWNNYGRVFAEYMFMKEFRSGSLSKNISIEGEEILQRIKENNQKVIFISGHFSNFELMAMHIEKAGIDCAAIYRPLNNKFLNKIMEKIRKRDICKKQIKKGLGGTREIVKLTKKGASIALMVDQRVREGQKISFFNHLATTTTIPAQLIKKYKLKLVPIYIERKNKNFFKLYISKPIRIGSDKSISEISLFINKILEKMIQKNVDQWIWTHDRWRT